MMTNETGAYTVLMHSRPGDQIGILGWIPVALDWQFNPIEARCMSLDEARTYVKACQADLAAKDCIPRSFWIFPTPGIKSGQMLVGKGNTLYQLARRRDA
jgi:hypothetical protein